MTQSERLDKLIWAWRCFAKKEIIRIRAPRAPSYDHLAIYKNCFKFIQQVTFNEWSFAEFLERKTQLEKEFVSLRKVIPQNHTFLSLLKVELKDWGVLGWWDKYTYIQFLQVKKNIAPNGLFYIQVWNHLGVELQVEVGFHLNEQKANPNHHTGRCEIFYFLTEEELRKDILYWNLDTDAPNCSGDGQQSGALSDYFQKSQGSFQTVPGSQLQGPSVFFCFCIFTLFTH